MGPDTFFHRLEELQLRPEGFATWLCESLGFRLVRRLAAPAAGPADAQADAEEAVEGTTGQPAAGRGFDRPIIVLRKPS